jgi:hypothetical protein
MRGGKTTTAVRLLHLSIVGVIALAVFSGWTRVADTVNWFDGPSSGEQSEPSDSSALPAAPIYVYDSFDAQYTLTRDADRLAQLHTVETIVPAAPLGEPNSGIARLIPTVFNGLAVSPIIESVTDGAGASVPFTETPIEGFIQVAIGGDMVRGGTAYVISYSQQNVVGSADDANADEFFWDVNGEQFSQTFGEVSATVRLDADLAGALTGDATCSRDATRLSGDRCSIEQATDAAGTTLSSSISFVPPNSTLTLEIGFDEGTFVVPQVAKPTNDAVEVLALFGIPSTPWLFWLPVGLLGGMGLLVVGAALVRTVGTRDAKGRDGVVPMSTAPKRLNLLTAGNLIGRTDEALAAQIVSLAVRGKLLLVDFGSLISVVYRNNENLDPHEEALMRALFAGDSASGAPAVDATTMLVTWDAALVHRLRSVQQSTGVLAEEVGLREPAHPRLRVELKILAGALALAAVTAALLAIDRGVEGLWTLVAVIGTALGLGVVEKLTRRQTVLTDAGARARDHLEGLRTSDGALRTFGDDQNDLVAYESLVPYAVLLDIGWGWAKELHLKYNGQSPTWYASDEVFDVHSVAATLTEFAHAVNNPRRKFRPHF